MFRAMSTDNRMGGAVSTVSRANSGLRPLVSLNANDYFAASGGFITFNRNYVNMADINMKAPQRPGSGPVRAPGQRTGEAGAAGELRWDIIELLFFAYRDFVGAADAVLAEFGFGRAHHRVIHFVHRYPGLKVADLLDVLRITKQSLGRVLKQLVDEGYIVQKAGDSDKRQRLLFATAKGEALVAKLAGLQTDRINNALSEMSAGDAEIVRRFLRNMIDLREPDKVLQIIMAGGKGGTRGTV